MKYPKKLPLRLIGFTANHTFCVVNVGKPIFMGTYMKTALTDAFIKNIKQAGRYTDAATTGLNFNIKSNGGGYWVFRYLFEGKRLDLL